VYPGLLPEYLFAYPVFLCEYLSVYPVPLSSYLSVYSAFDGLGLTLLDGDKLYEALGEREILKDCEADGERDTLKL